MTLRPTLPQRRSLLRFAAVMAIGNLLWEVAHVRLYTLWQTGTPAEISYDILHCTAGDILIGATCLCLALAAFGRGWPDRNFARVAGASIVAALGYTVFSEWLNTEIRGTWAYGPAMPRLPPLGTGLTPVLQWIVVPALAFVWARPQDPDRSGHTPRHR